jgi:hypothetical protein
MQQGLNRSFCRISQSIKEDHVDLARRIRFDPKYVNGLDVFRSLVCPLRHKCFHCAYCYW